MTPRVTIFIPTYNRASWLRQSIESVLAQTYRDFLLVVADNASSDETPDVVANYSDPRLVHVRRPANLGLLGNYRACLESLTTEVVGFLSDDDLLAPEHLASTMAVLDLHPRVGMVHTGFDVVGPAGAVLRPGANWTGTLSEDAIEPGRRFIRQSMEWSCRVCCSTALLRRQALPPQPFSEADGSAFDFGLWLRIALDWEVAFLARPLARYRVHASSETAAFAPPLGSGYVQDVEHLGKLKDIKLRFLEAHREQLGETARLQALAERGMRRDLVTLARNLTLPERRPGPTLRLLGQLSRGDRRVWLEVAAWRLLAGTLLGPRRVAWLKGLRHREGTPGPVVDGGERSAPGARRQEGRR